MRVPVNSDDGAPFGSQMDILSWSLRWFRRNRELDTTRWTRRAALPSFCMTPVCQARPRTRRPDLSRDGKTIFHGEIDADLLGTKLLRFDIESGKETVLKRWESPTRGTARFVTSIAVSPDGKQLAYIVSDNPARAASVDVMSSDGGESREIFRSDAWLDDSRFAGLAWTPDQRYLVFIKPEKADPTRRRRVSGRFQCRVDRLKTQAFQ